MKTIDKKKQNGEVFTPQGLADFLANRMLPYLKKEVSLRVCDPSCGDGALLCAMAKALTGTVTYPFTLTGTDKDNDFLCKAETNLQKMFPTCEMSFELKDFIEEKVDSLFGSHERYDVIVGNPPYVRTQALGNDKSQAIAKLYGLNGRVDLYYPFLINMTDSLDEGGILGVITSNRYISTKSGESIRKYLLEHYDVLEIIDLGDTKLFDAAVLPAIFIGRKNLSKTKNDRGLFFKIYENQNGVISTVKRDTVYNILNSYKTGCYDVNGICYDYSAGTFTRPEVLTDIWQMNTEEEHNWKNIIKSNTYCYVGDKFKVRVGVKSCADEVFMNDALFESKDKPEDVFFRNMISQENITAWTISDNLFHVIYPHYDNKGKKDVLDIEDYPLAKAFFIKNEARLKKRTYIMKSKRKWYEYWVPQNATLWKYPKLVFPDISVEPRFAIDTTGSIVNGNCYWIYASNEEDLNLLYLIEGVANSNLMIRYHDLTFNNKLYSGRKRYLTQYVEKYPIPNPNSVASKRVIAIAKELHNDTELEMRDDLLTELNTMVERAFGFTQD